MIKIFTFCRTFIYYVDFSYNMHRISYGLRNNLCLVNTYFVQVDWLSLTLIKYSRKKQYVRSM